MTEIENAENNSKDNKLNNILKNNFLKLNSN